MIKPTVEEITICFNDKLDNWAQSKDEAERFINHYESNGWMVGKTPMKKWGFAVLNWIKNINQYKETKQPSDTKRMYFTKEEANDRRT